MRRLLIPSLESLSMESDKEDTVSMNVPLMIRIFEYIREDVKEDVEIHDIAERLVALSNNSEIPLSMDDYESIIGKASEEGLKNKTHTTIVINMENIDQAEALTDALNTFGKKAKAGGDVEMFISTSDDEPKSCGVIGHDVIIGKTYHNVPDDDKDKKKD